MQNRFLWVTFFWLFSSWAMAQTIIVQDGLTAAPLSGVLVYQPTSGVNEVSDEKGRVEVAAFSDSEEIFFQFLGYKSISISKGELKEGGVVRMHEQIISLDEVVTSANRWEQEKKHISQEIVRISNRQLGIESPQTSADLLAASGQVFVQKSQLGGGSPMIRGFAANSVLIVLDGVRVNNAIFRSGNLQNIILVDPLNIQSAEVVMGPGSVMFGSDALGGVMNFTTHQPELSRNESWNVFGDAMMRYSTANNEKTFHFDNNIGHKKWALYSSITYSDFGDLRTGSKRDAEYPDWGKRMHYVIRENGEDVMVENPDPNVQKFTGYWQWNQMHKLRYQLSEGSFLQYGFWFTTSSDVPRYDRLTRYRNGVLRDAEWYYGPQDWMMHQLQWVHEKKTAFSDQFRISLAFQDIEESRHSRSFQSDILESNVENVKAFNVNLDVEKSIGQSLNLTYGAEWVNNQVDSEGFSTNIETSEKGNIDARYPIGGSTVNSGAVYANFTWKATAKLTLNAGARYNLYQLEAISNNRSLDVGFEKAQINTSSVNGSLGLSYRPAASWQLNVHAGTGFRAPNVDDIGKIFDAGGNQIDVPNANLNPENVYSLEASVSKTFSDRVQLTVTAYRSWLRDKMISQPFEFQGSTSVEVNGETWDLFALQNVGKAYIYGFFTHLKVKLSEQFRWDAKYTYGSGTDQVNNAPIRHVPPPFGESSLEWKYKKWRVLGQFRFSGGYTLEELAPEEQGKTEIYREDGSPSWSVFDVHASYRFSRFATLQVGLENLLDRHYRTYSSGISAPGRNFIVSLRGKF